MGRPASVALKERLRGGATRRVADHLARGEPEKAADAFVAARNQDATIRENGAVPALLLAAADLQQGETTRGIEELWRGLLLNPYAASAEAWQALGSARGERG